MNPIQSALSSIVTSGTAQAAAGDVAARTARVGTQPRPAATQDRVTISQAARLLQAEDATVNADRAERLARLSAQVASGQYPVDARVIAQGLLRDSRDLIAAARSAPPQA